MSASAILTTRPFAEMAIPLVERGLAVIPCPGDDGKSPLGAISNFHLWKRRPSINTVSDWIFKWGDANIGIITSLSDLTVADVDGGGKDAEEIIRRAGDTPLIVRTPSSGFHLYYRSRGEKSANLRSCGLAVDVRGSSGHVIVPPSFRPSTGVLYVFERGSWDDLDRLPFAKPGSLSVHFSGSSGSKLLIQTGERNDALYRMALREVRQCDDLDALMDVLATRNEELAEPLPVSEIAKIATSAWKRETTGTNFVGQEQRAQIEASAVRLLSPLENGPDALMLLTHLRLAHGARQTRGEEFAISPRAMSAARRIGHWSPQRYRNARQTLIDLGLISQTHQGGRSGHDPSLFRLRN
jgi:Bifunctional DNA primase/polymerase, N-terminal/Primase C terminal 1 (PriCT-1)